MLIIAKTKEKELASNIETHDVGEGGSGGARRTKASTRVPPVSEDIGEFQGVVAELQKTKYITDVLALGDKKCMAVVKLPRCRTHRRLDILLTPPSEYPYALLYFTGSQEFNIGMRTHALSRGYTLNEHGMKPLLLDGNNKNPTAGDIKEERDIFTYLKLGFVRPEDRTENIFVD
jgi:DNA polymerase (family 10)